MLAPTPLVLLGVLSLHGCVAAQSINPILKDTAINLDRTLTCAKWDCACTLNRQRGCCCAANDMFRVEDETLMRMMSLSGNISKLKRKVDALTTAIKIAFKANLKMASDQCYGPFNTKVPIAYTEVSLNYGNGYNPSLGIFTAPHAGVFVFSCTVYSLVNMVKNGEVMTSVWENNMENGEDSASQTLTLEMQRGDQVYMELDVGKQLCQNLNHNVFSGYMLYAYTDE
ncbi:cerebellin 18 [Dunckerocampus dactyliophorus]|uniref:cerebellin 18 n=1 Tax=Dunckerocampus dactyliophorus TaxID=161453 RepID=UPI002405DD1A|nr:cerebellin 18 [Dunckerocampus dactyliophorus]